MMKVFHRYLEGDKKIKTVEALNKFNDLAKELECNMAQLAMAWCISHPDITCAITGCSRP